MDIVVPDSLYRQILYLNNMSKYPSTKDILKEGILSFDTPYGTIVIKPKPDIEYCEEYTKTCYRYKES